jgi:hypothetical protein
MEPKEELAILLDHAHFDMSKEGYYTIQMEGYYRTRVDSLSPVVPEVELKLEQHLSFLELSNLLLKPKLHFASGSLYNIADLAFPPLSYTFYSKPKPKPLLTQLTPEEIPYVYHGIFYSDVSKELNVLKTYYCEGCMRK